LLLQFQVQTSLSFKNTQTIKSLSWSGHDSLSTL
jgi:hypothetical protein